MSHSHPATDWRFEDADPHMVTSNPTGACDEFDDHDDGRLCGGSICGWCKGPIRAAARSDSIYCGQRCRQAAHRFHKPSRSAGATVGVDPGLPRRFAYADPPYPTLARKYYADEPDFAGEVDHRALISRLASSYDGWALSTSARALPALLPLCPPGTQVAAWFRGERPTDCYSPLVGWEPILYFGARPFLRRHGIQPRRVDALVHIARPRLTDPARVIGAKPAAFCAWLFLLLGLMHIDELVDLFPGSGGVSAAWETYRLAAAQHDASRMATRDASRDRDKTELNPFASGSAGPGEFRLYSAMHRALHA